MNLPSGTVTFLFTDIEGSTRLWETYPEAMRRALARHDALLRRTIEENRGLVFKTLGDAFCAVFATASDALAAALAAQIALQQEGRSREPGADTPYEGGPTDEEGATQSPDSSSLPPSLTLRVRMALHTGACELRDNDYFGPPLNRVARLLAVGHGGQILLSHSTQELVRDGLPSLSSLLDLGSHRLRDLQRPEQVFQLQFPDLTSAFPPLKSLNNPLLPNNLPRQMTSFIGREREIAEIKALLGTTRLLTLTGAGGCGKTRLALQVAAEMLDGTGDGVWFIELAPLAEPGLVPQALASILGVKEEPGRPLTRTLCDFLKTKQMLFLLDNCEHLLDACAHLTDTLLRHCPSLTLLASSREGLGIAGERTYRMPSLSMPRAPGQTTAQNLLQYEAARLFVERATFHQPAFAVTSQNAPIVAQLCVRLDGIPLAVELAAARVRSLSVAEINSRLGNRFRLLTGGSRTALPRQQTLRALIDWSYDLLNEQEKALLCRLSVFASGWTLSAAEAVGGDAEIEDWEVLDLLTSLVDKSLVMSEQMEEQTRYRLLETMRQYGQERLTERGESETVRARHRDFYLTLAEMAAPRLLSAEQPMWLNRLEMEHDNLRMAIAFSREDPPGAQADLRLVTVLCRFWYVRGYYSEGREHLAGALARPDGQRHSELRRKALLGAGVLHDCQGDYAAARSMYEQSLAISRELNDRRGMASALNNLGLVAHAQGDYAAARLLFEECLALFQELGDLSGISYAFSNLGNVEVEVGDYSAARSLLEQGLAIKQEQGDRGGMAGALGNLGNVAVKQGDYAAARALYEQSRTIYQELGDRRGMASALNNLGQVAHAQDDHRSAQALQKESLTLYRELGNRKGIVEALVGMASLELEHGAAECAVTLYGAANALYESLNLAPGALERAAYERDMTRLRQQMGAEAFAAADQRGRALTLEQAIACALDQPSF